MLMGVVLLGVMFVFMFMLVLVLVLMVWFQVGVLVGDRVWKSGATGSGTTRCGGGFGHLGGTTSRRLNDASSGG